MFTGKIAVLTLLFAGILILGRCEVANGTLPETVAENAMTRIHERASQRM